MAPLVGTRITSVVVRNVVRLGESTSKLVGGESAVSTRAVTEAITGAVSRELITATLTIEKSKRFKNLI
jgi:hypothetical protein